MKNDDVTTGLLLPKCDESLKDCLMLNKKMQLKSSVKSKQNLYKGPILTLRIITLNPIYFEEKYQNSHKNGNKSH